MDIEKVYQSLDVDYVYSIPDTMLQVGTMNSSVLDLLRIVESSNAPLLDAEKRQLRALISSLRKDIDPIHSTISHRHSRDFVSSRSAKSALLLRLEAAVSLIRDLPLEIVAEILSLCVLAPVNLRVSRPENAPWNLTQICSVWRGVALGLPSLWNDIAVELLCDDQEKCIHQRNLLATFLSRARNSTISLDMYASMFYDHNPFCQPFIDSIIDCVQPYVTQLKSLELQPPEVFMPILELPSGMVHALEIVSLIFAKEDDDSPSSFESGNGLTDNITIFDAAHNLRFVTLISQYAYMHLTAFRFPWSQLTQLDILDTYVDFEDGHKVLRQCTSLVSCSIGVAVDVVCDATLPPTLLPNLVSLTVHAYFKVEEHGRFLQPFVLPSLQYLELASRDHAPWSEMHVTHLIRRSKPAKFECFCCTALTVRDVTAILTEVPLLEELSLCFHRSEPDPSLDALITAIARGDLVPNIRSFELEVNTTLVVWPRRVPRITVHCRPEEIRPCFWDFWVRVQKQASMDIVIQADGFTIGVNDVYAVGT
jgi:hypothetical protein